jgi:Fur family zinc uptake transcriptional regulator
MDISATLSHAEQECAKNGARLTDKRKQVLESLLRSSRALSAYELIDQLEKEQGSKFAAMSVYRILDFLEQQVLVHKLNIANKYVACSHISCAHAHQVPQFLICGSCNKVQEIGIDKSMVDVLKSNIADAGFQLTSQQFEFSCVCKECSSSSEQ